MTSPLVRTVALVILATVCLRVSAFAARRVDRTVVVDGLTREYVVWIPDGAQRGAAMPVVLAFHGGGGRIESLEENSSLHEARDAQNYLIVYPAGYQRTFNVGGYCCGPAARQNINDLAFVHALLDDLDWQVKIDRRRIYSTGFSNGGQLSYYLACHMSDEIAAIASVSGAMQPPFDTCHPTRAVPVMHWAGLDDRFDPFAGGQSALRSAPVQPPVMQGIELWRRLDGAATTQPVNVAGPGANCTESSGGRNGAAVVLCLVPGLGHQWPGQNQQGGSARTQAWLGPLGPRMDVNDAILDFFGRYSLP